MAEAAFGGPVAAAPAQVAPLSGVDAPPQAQSGQYDAGNKRPRAEDFGTPSKRPAQDGVKGAETVYRFLVNAALVQGLAGSNNEVLQEISQRTGAFLHLIQEAPPHCQERVIVVSSSRDAQQAGDVYNGAQLAVFELFEKQLNIERNPPPGGPFLRMLICNTQAGSLIGKGGATIRELRETSGVQNIKVLQPEDLPPCALASDKLLHITGQQDALKTVLQQVTRRLRDSPPREMPSHEPSIHAYPPGSVQIPSGGASMRPPMGGPGGYRGGGGGGYMGPPPGAYGMGPPGGMYGGMPPRGPPMYAQGPPGGGMPPRY